MYIIIIINAMWCVFVVVELKNKMDFHIILMWCGVVFKILFSITMWCGFRKCDLVSTVLEYGAVFTHT